MDYSKWHPRAQLNSHAPSPKPFLLPGHKFFLAPLLQIDQLPLWIIVSSYVLANQCLIPSTIAHFSFMIISWPPSAYIKENIASQLIFSYWYLTSGIYIRLIIRVSQQQSDSDSALKEKWGESFKLNLVSQSSEQHIIMTVTEHTWDNISWHFIEASSVTYTEKGNKIMWH